MTVKAKPPGKKSAGKVLVFDTTLRDGNQTPNANFSRTDRLAVARQLADAGVDVIEAGFPAAGEGDFKAVEAVAAAVGDRVTVSAFSRILLPDIEAAGAALTPAKAHSRARLHTGVGTSDLHVRLKLRKTPAQILEAVQAGVTRARELTDDVEFYAEDATRSDFRFLMQVLLTAARAGAGTLMIPDTVGVATPASYGTLIRKIKHRLDAEFGAGTVKVAAHCHDDLGLATANTLAAVAAGADEVQVAVGGMGERAGNARLETVVMNLALRPAAFGGRTTGVDTTKLTALASDVTRRAGLSLSASAPVVGDNAFKHASGIHQNGVEKAAEVYEPYKAALAGQATSMSNDALSGRSGIRARLRHLGMDSDAEALRTISTRAKELAGKENRSVVDSDIEAIAAAVTGETLTDQIHLSDFTATKAKGAPSTGSVLIGGVRENAATYGGELDAVAIAINKATGMSGKIKRWVTTASGLADSTAAEVGVFTTVVHGGHEVEVYSHSSSSLEAAIDAYVKALNLLCRVKAREARLAQLQPVVEPQEVQT